MTNCPIGLICEYFECDHYGSGYCQDLADPWPLPYFKEPCWMPGVGFLVILPAYKWDCPNIEYMITENERYNRWVERVRDDYWLYGWWNAIDLPYEEHPGGGILVIHDLRLDESITFSHPWRYNPKVKYDISPTHWEEFMRPVPLDGYRHSSTENIEPDGFYRDWLLRWASDFEENDYDDGYD